jgi:hypothetical protein
MGKRTRSTSRFVAVIAVLLGCGDGTTNPTDMYPECLTSFERELATIINAERADSGRAGLAVDTRLVQAARHTAAERAAGNATFFDFGTSYGYTGTAGTTGVGAFTAAGFWTAIRTSPDQELARAAALSASSRHLGVGTLETSPGTTAAIAFLIGTAPGAATTDGNCVP